MISEPSASAHLFINGRFLTQRVTGVQRYALEFCLALDGLLDEERPGSRDLAATLLLPRDATDPPPLKRISWRRVGVLGGHLWEQLELPFHSRAGLLLNLANTGPCLRREQIATIFDAAILAFPEAYGWAFRTWYRFLLPLLGRRARRVVTLSKFSRGELERRLGISSEKVAVATGGGEHILRSPADRGVLERHGLGVRPFVLAVSSLTPTKNFGSVVRAMELIGEQPGYDFVVAGGANPRVFSSSGRDLPGLVKHVGYVTDQELRALYEAATCFVFPSIYEGFGIPPLEAMVCGCPVLASRAASVQEVCGDAVAYCDARDPADIAAQLQRVMFDERLRAELSRSGRDRAKMYSWRRCADENVAVINALIGR